MLFTKLDGLAVVSLPKGVYKQVATYRRTEKDGTIGLYIAIKGGFVAVYADGATGHPDVRVDHIERPAGYTTVTGRYNRVKLLEEVV